MAGRWLFKQRPGAVADHAIARARRVAGIAQVKALDRQAAPLRR
jgi:hypothetical protein